MVDLPAPVWPTSATVSPGAIDEADPGQGLRRLALVAEMHVPELDQAAAGPGGRGLAASGVEVGVRSSSLIRRRPTDACW